jgi:hypothetical protein
MPSAAVPLQVRPARSDRGGPCPLAGRSLRCFSLALFAFSRRSLRSHDLSSAILGTGLALWPSAWADCALAWHQRLHLNSSIVSDGLTVFTAILAAGPWPATAAPFVPYVYSSPGGWSHNDRIISSPRLFCFGFGGLLGRSMQCRFDGRNRRQLGAK